MQRKRRRLLYQAVLAHGIETDYPGDREATFDACRSIVARALSLGHCYKLDGVAAYNDDRITVTKRPIVATHDPSHLPPEQRAFYGEANLVNVFRPRRNTEPGEVREDIDIGVAMDLDSGTAWNLVWRDRMKCPLLVDVLSWDAKTGGYRVLWVDPRFDGSRPGFQSSAPAYPLGLMTALGILAAKSGYSKPEPASALRRIGVTSSRDAREVMWFDERDPDLRKTLVRGHLRRITRGRDEPLLTWVCPHARRLRHAAGPGPRMPRTVRAIGASRARAVAGGAAAPSSEVSDLGRCSAGPTASETRTA